MSATTAPPRRPRGRQLPPGPLPPTEPPPDAERRPRVWRVIVGCLIVVALSAATTVVFIKGEIKTLASALSQNKALALGSGSLASAGFGDPQTILLVGNDQRRPICCVLANSVSKRLNRDRLQMARQHCS